MDEQEQPRKQWYVALRRIGGDGEVWLPGSLIALTDEKARILLEKGAVTPHIDTKAPEPAPPAIVVHEPPSTSSGGASTSSGGASTGGPSTGSGAEAESGGE